MYLKRLELFGFKTFAERVELELSPGITAVVGPNGSGKSNLAEAILWVFGEQSLKALRSSRSQDVIFAGSKDKKAVGLAEVSLTLDNSSNRLGLDFSELTVTRRVYRSGEGEYFLNRVPCRLRDIHELFLDTGIGRQAYSIINQSQIDAILSVRPEDRRELVEEVAGVGKYRQRKKETLRKLDATRANLLRVNDIMGELESQLEPLAQQSEAAREYAGIAKVLGALRLSLLVADHDAYTISLDRAKEREAELEQAVEACRSKEAQQSADEAEQRAAMTHLDSELDELRSLVARVSQETDRQEGQEALLRERIAANERQRAGLEGDRSQFSEGIVRLRHEQDDAARRQAEIAERERVSRQDLDERESALTAIDAEAAAQEKAIAEARAGQLDLMGKAAEVSNRRAQGASLLHAAESRLARVSSECGALDGELAGLSVEETDKAAEVEQLTAAIPELQSQLNALRQRRDAAHRGVRECEEAESTLTRETLGVRSRLEALEALAKAREGTAPSVRELAETGLPLASDLLRVPSRCAAAIEVALGPWLEGLVCESREQALRGRDFLRDKKGQGAFLFLAELSVGAADEQTDLPAAPGIIGPAIGVVECDERYRPLFTHLLRRVLLAETLAAALDVAPKLSGGDWRIVTLDGELVTAAGAILGTEHGAEGPLARQAQIADLRERLSVLERDLARAQQASVAARAALEALTDELGAAEKELGQRQAAKARAADALDMLRAQVAGVRRRLANLETEAHDLTAEIAQSREEQSALEQQASAIEAETAQARAALASSEAALQAIRERREAAAREIAQMRVGLTSLGGERKALETRLLSLAENERALTKQIGDREESLRTIAAEREQLLTDLDAAGKHLDGLRTARQRAQSELDQANAKRQQALEAVAAHLEEQKANREQREAHQASLHRLQLRITQLEGELAFLQRNLEEDHRISLEKARELSQPVDNRKEAQERLRALQEQVDALGTVNLGAMDEYERVKTRLDFLSGQRTDLEQAREDLEKVIAEIDATAREKFLETFEQVQREFQGLFQRLFEGGETELKLTGEGEILESGIDVEVTVPGKRRQNLLLLSGGERALTAMALVFALMRVKPTPFVVMDEIDAPLDDSNVGRFSELLRDFARESQFICITHNKATMEAADTLYGVTMQKAGVSSLISMRLSELPG